MMILVGIAVVVMAVPVVVMGVTVIIVRVTVVMRLSERRSGVQGEAKRG